MTEPSYGRLFLVLALGGAFLDQATKYGVFSALYNNGAGGSRPVVSGIFEILTQFTGAHETENGALPWLRTVGGSALPKVNHGAVFGILSEHVQMANALFALISLAAALAIAIWARSRGTRADGWLSASLGLILAGTLGNVYDRIVFGGVRDFLHLHYYESFDWPVFNVADCCLVAGAILLMLQAFFGKPTPVSTAAAEPRELAKAHVP